MAPIARPVDKIQSMIPNDPIVLIAGFWRGGGGGGA